MSPTESSSSQTGGSVCAFFPRDETREFTSPRSRGGETAAHLALKRLALLWAQENGFPIAAPEISLPKCRYRADVAAYRPRKDHSLGITAIFECKQSSTDLRRDDRRGHELQAELARLFQRQQTLEKNLRMHYPTLRTGEALFPEWDGFDFIAIKHRSYRRITRQLAARQRQLRNGRKFEKIARYACANLFYLVVPNELVHEPSAPWGWGLLVESSGALSRLRKPLWHESPAAARLHLLQKIAAAGTRQLTGRTCSARGPNSPA